VFSILVLIEDCLSSDLLNINRIFSSLPYASVSKRVLMQNLSHENEFDLHGKSACRRNTFSTRFGSEARDNSEMAYIKHIVVVWTASHDVLEGMLLKSVGNVFKSGLKAIYPIRSQNQFVCGELNAIISARNVRSCLRRDLWPCNLTRIFSSSFH